MYKYEIVERQKIIDNKPTPRYYVKDMQSKLLHGPSEGFKTTDEAEMLKADMEYAARVKR